MKIRIVEIEFGEYFWIKIIVLLFAFALWAFSTFYLSFASILLFFFGILWAEIIEREKARRLAEHSEKKRE